MTSIKNPITLELVIMVHLTQTCHRQIKLIGYAVLLNNNSLTWRKYA